MKIHILNNSSQGRGGGFSWLSNIVNQLGENYETNPEEADVILIPSASMVDRSTVTPYVGKKKIVLRTDNFLKDSRNRGTGMTRMSDFASWADVVIFQSDWARKSLVPFLPPLKASVVILNGSDDTMFVPKRKKEPRAFKRFLYVRQNRDESKNPHMAFSKYREIRGENDELWIVGQFGPDSTEWNFDLGNLPVKYLGSVPYEQMPNIYRECDAFLYSYFSDACSNSLSEAMMCGLEIIDCYGMLSTGGAKEQMEAGVRTSKQMAQEYLDLFCDIVK